MISLTCGSDKVGLRNKEKNDACQGLGSEGNGEVLAKGYKVI